MKAYLAKAKKRKAPMLENIGAGFGLCFKA